VKTAADCERRIREIYDPRPADEPPASGRTPLSGDLARASGVLHVTAVARGEGPALETIAIGPRSPRSATDFFLLNLARARADAIVTTGKILRDELEVEHVLQGEQGEPAALAAWRAERLGKREPPLSVVLTGGRGIDFDHPLLHSAPRAIVLTSVSGAAALHLAARRAGVEVVARTTPGLADTIEYLRGERGCSTIAIEAGPSTTRELYVPGAAVVDELMLSIYEEGPLDADLRAGRFLAEADLERLLPWQSVRRVVREWSGIWSYRRLRRS
jgi:hypothetical protein